MNSFLTFLKSTTFAQSRRSSCQTGRNLWARHSVQQLEERVMLFHHDAEFAKILVRVQRQHLKANSSLGTMTIKPFEKSASNCHKTLMLNRPQIPGRFCTEFCTMQNDPRLFVPRIQSFSVSRAGVEPTTFGFGGRHSIQLSYRDKLSDHKNLEPQERGSSPQAEFSFLLFLLRVCNRYRAARRVNISPRKVRWR